jgi:hypothetical protein
MPTEDDFPLRDMMSHAGWSDFRRAMHEKAASLQKRLELHKYDSLDEVKADQAMLKFVKRFLGKEDEVLQFLATHG